MAEEVSYAKEKAEQEGVTRADKLKWSWENLKMPGPHL